MTPPAAASAAGLCTLVHSTNGATRWEFSSPNSQPGSSSIGRGLFAVRNLAVGDVILREEWLRGRPLQSSIGRACEQCLRILGDAACNCEKGCGARYCGIACRTAAWRGHHKLLCTSVPVDGQSQVHPLVVFRKHAKLAPSAIEQKEEEVQLAAEMLAMCVLEPTEGEKPAAIPGRASAVPPPFDALQSCCVVSKARASGESAVSARAKWVGDSYRLLLASALGRHPNFAKRCPPNVYSHALGLIDVNGASTMAVGRPADNKRRKETADGVGIFPLFSFANHCCNPNTINAKLPADGSALLESTLVLRAAKALQAGEEICFDYLDLEYVDKQKKKSAGERRSLLKVNFGFECACVACR